MPAHKKKTGLRKCDRCGQPSKRSYAFETICEKCRHRLPKCDSCHTVMAPEYGSLEGFAREVGKYKICGGCNYELKRKGFLHISETQILLPSGRIKHVTVAEDDKLPPKA